jgi:hypothetical protein
VKYESEIFYMNNTVPSNTFGIRGDCDLYIFSINGW